MELLPGLIAIDVGLYQLPTHTLILSDLHLGYEEELRRSGVLMPRTQFAELRRRIHNILTQLPSAPLTVVLNGDIKHSFGRVHHQEVNDFAAIIRILQTRGNANIVAIAGNHDPLLNGLLQQHNMISHSNYRVGNVLITHGDDIPKELKNVSTIIIGHDHPAVVLRDKSKQEKYKCYLVGKYKRFTIVVQPSAQPLLHGTDVLTEPLLSPFLPRISRHRVFAVEESTGDVLALGTVQSLRRKLRL